MEDLISYHILKSKYSENKLPYGELLSTLEWKEFRDIIVKRDGNKCKICLCVGSEKDGKHYFRKITEAEKAESHKDYLDFSSHSDDLKLKYGEPINKLEKTPIILHVHHTYYIKNHLPWQYDYDSLLTVCQHCHNHIHQNTKIFVYEDSSKKKQLTITSCERCFGTGFLSEFHYYENGVCFSCSGNRYYELT